jgi:small-conductance mechanosensitive channel
MMEQTSEFLVFLVGLARVGTPLLLAPCLLLLLTVVVAAFVGRVCEGLVTRFWPDTSPGRRVLVTRVVRWALVGVGVLLTVGTLGVGSGAAVASGTVIFVGVGLAVQKVVQSFAAGTLLLAERAVARGDVLHIDGESVRVQRVGM